MNNEIFTELVEKANKDYAERVSKIFNKELSYEEACLKEGNWLRHAEETASFATKLLEEELADCIKSAHYTKDINEREYETVIALVNDINKLKNKIYTAFGLKEQSLDNNKNYFNYEIKRSS